MIEDIGDLSGSRPGPGTLYGAIARLERLGLIEPLAAVDRRRPYQLTSAGETVLREELATLGMNKPVIPGIMPILSLASVKRMSELAGYAVPADVVDRLSPLEGDPKEFRRVGIELACELCRELLDEGAPGLHFYTLNFSKATMEIYRSLELPAQETIA